MGERGAKGQPVRLDKFRLTSPAKHLLDAAAALWGGEVQPWSGAPTDGQWELYTQTDVLPIIIPPGREPVSSFYETWSGGGCTHRCDGVTNYITDTPCSCDPEKRTCKATSRLSVMLPDLPDIGVWRAESHGINAAMEWPGTIAVLQMASDAGRFIPARLRLEQRMSKKDGRTNRFVVPVIDMDITSRELMAGEQPALDQSETKFIESGADALAAPEQPEGVAPSGGRVEPSAPVVGSGAEGSPATIGQKDIARMMAVAKEHSVGEAELKDIVLDIAGVKSRKLIPVDRFDAVLQTIRNWAELKAMSDGEG